jgi:hypothetical protein
MWKGQKAGAPDRGEIMSTVSQKSAQPAPVNLRRARKEQAKARADPAGKQAPAAKKAPAKASPTPPAAASEKVRKAPSTSDKAKLRWEGDIAKSEGPEIGRRIEQNDGTYHAAIKNDGKVEILATGVSKDRAYAIVTRFYHYNERPAQKAAKATPKKAS